MCCVCTHARGLIALRLNMVHGGEGGGVPAPIDWWRSWWSEQVLVFLVDQIYWMLRSINLNLCSGLTILVHAEHDPDVQDEFIHIQNPQNIQRAWGSSSNKGTSLWFDATRWIKITIKIKQNNSFFFASFFEQLEWQNVVKETTAKLQFLQLTGE